MFEISALDVLTTTRSVRKRLDFEKPIDPKTLEEVVEIAIQAPTGSNSQGWGWIFVTDKAKKEEIGKIYLENFKKYLGLRQNDNPGLDQSKIVQSSIYLAENISKAPVMLIPIIEGVSEDRQSQASLWGSIIPAAWSFMLGLRTKEMGTAWTTLHLIDGGEEKVAKILGIPYEKYSQAGLFPIAYTVGTDFKPAKRNPASDIIYWDKFS